MTSWDEAIFSDEINEDFLDDLAELDDDEIVEAIRDACLLADSAHASETEVRNGQAAATIAAIWAGAPFSAGQAVADYPFIKQLSGNSSEELSDTAASVLAQVDDDYDLEPFMEALSF